MRSTSKVVLTGTPWIFLRVSLAAFWAALSGSSVLVINTDE